MLISKKHIMQLVICLITLIPTSYGQGNNTPFTITGKVYYTENVPAENYTVCLVEIEKSTAKGEIKIKKGVVTNPSIKTNKKGVFKMEIDYTIKSQPKHFLLSGFPANKNDRILPMIVDGKPLLIDIPQDKATINVGTVILPQ